MSIVDKVKKIIAEKLNVGIEDVIPEARFIEDLGADSLDIAELIMAMEDHFDLDISDDDAETLITVENVLDYINEKA